MLDLLDTISIKRLALGLIAGLVVLSFFSGIRGVVQAQIDAKIAEERSKIVLQVNEHTQARFAKHRADKDSLAQALEAADQLNGELVAALSIRVPADTVYVEIETVVTDYDTTDLGITRRASLTDTTEQGVEVDIQAVAPADQTLPLQLGYTLFFPEQRPEIAFIETEEGVYASVSWLNQNFQVEAPYFRPVRENQKPLRLNAGALVTSPMVMDPRLMVYLEAEYRPSTMWAVTIPFGVDTNGTYLGLGIRKTLLAYDNLWDLLNPF